MTWPSLPRRRLADSQNILQDELAAGTRSVGRPTPHFKDKCKRHLKAWPRTSTQQIGNQAIAIKFGLCSPMFRQCCLLQGGMLKVHFRKHHLLYLLPEMPQSSLRWGDGRRLADHFRELRLDLLHNKGDLPVAQHFNGPSHSLDMPCCGNERGTGTEGSQTARGDETHF